MQTRFIDPVLFVPCPALSSLPCALQITANVVLEAAGGQKIGENKKNKERSQRRENAWTSLSVPTQVLSFPGSQSFLPYFPPLPQSSLSRMAPESAFPGSPGPCFDGRFPSFATDSVEPLAGCQGAPLLITLLTAIHFPVIWRQLGCQQTAGPALLGSYITTNMRALPHRKQVRC